MSSLDELCYYFHPIDGLPKQRQIQPQNARAVQLLLAAMRRCPLKTCSIEPVAVLHIPHSATLVPAKLRASLLLTDQELQLEQRRMTDWFTDELFELKSSLVSSVRFPISRLVVDPERFELDHLEPMAAKGMGVIYTRTSQGNLLRVPPCAQQRQLLIDTYYKPHHQRLTHAVEHLLTYREQALVIDCHSFSSQPLPHEDDQSNERADICIGADPYHTPPSLLQSAVSLFENEGFDVAVNQPFSGALVPNAFYQVNPKVFAIMVEVNRSLYMHEESGNKHSRFDQVKQQLQRVVNALLERYS